ncbi:MAG: hypothetical protein IPK19_13320 [Chloroflexi bacterium]|nr:hypothetical protein [Chloroflexota bacterium]
MLERATCPITSSWRTPASCDLYKLAGDVLSIAVIVGVAYFLLRRFVLPNQKG